MPVVEWITPVFDRTLEDCVYGNQRGSITAEVLNRIENNIQFLKELFEEFNIAYSGNVETYLEWNRQMYYRLNALRRIEISVLSLRTSGLIESDTPKFVPSLEEAIQLYTHYNDIERICFDLMRVFERYVLDLRYCGELYPSNNRDAWFELGFGQAVLSTEITYTVEQIGGIENASDTSGIKIIFNQPVSFLTMDKISVIGKTGEAIVGNLFGTGAEYFLEFTEIVRQGTVEISLLPFGDFFSNERYEIAIYKAKLITISAQLSAATYGVAATIIFDVTSIDMADGEYDVIINDLPEGMYVLPIVLKDNKGVLTIETSVTTPSARYTFTATVGNIPTQPFNVCVMIEDFLYTGMFYAGNDRDEQYFEGSYGVAKYAQQLTYTVTQIGGEEDIQNTVAIQITFNEDVQYFRASDIILIDDTGSATAGALIGSGNSYQLELSTIALQGNIFVRISDFADYQIITTELPLTIYKGRTATVSEQIGALTNGVAGSVQYLVTTDGIVDGDYLLTIDTLPEGAYNTNITILNGKGMFTIFIDEYTLSAKHLLRAYIDRVYTNLFVLAITANDFLVAGDFYAQTNHDDQLFEMGNGKASLVTEVAFIASQVGGVIDETSSTGIRIVFSGSVNHFTLDAISIENIDGEIDTGLLTGTGSTYILTIDRVHAQGFVRITIHDFGNYQVVSEAQDIQIFSGRRISVDPQYTAVTQGLAGTAYFDITAEGVRDGSYSVTIDNLPAGTTVNSITILDGTGVLSINVDKYTLSGRYVIRALIDGLFTNEFYLIVTVEDFIYLGGFYGNVNKDAQLFEVGAGLANTAAAVTFTVTQLNGVENITNTSGIKIVFSQPVTYLTASAISFINDTGIAVKGTLTGSGDTYVISVLQVIEQGTICVHIEPFSDFYCIANDVPVIVYRGKTVYIGEQIGAVAAGIPGSVKFPVDAFNISDGVYELYVANLPVGVTADTTVTIANMYGQFSVYGNMSTLAGKYYLAATIDTIQSNTFMLAITN